MRLHALAVVTLTFASAARAQSAAPATHEQAHQLYLDGKAAAAQGDAVEAYRIFRKLWTLRQSHDVAANLGVLELLLGKPREAAEHLYFAFRMLPANSTEGEIQAVRASFEQAKQRVGTLLVRLHPDRATLHLDGQPVEGVPIPASPNAPNELFTLHRELMLFVNPGGHHYRATAAASEPVSGTVQIGSGETAQLHLVLVPLLTSAPPPIIPLAQTPLAARGGLPPGALPEPEVPWVPVLGFSMAGGSLVLGSALLATDSDDHGLTAGSFVAGAGLGALTLFYLLVSDSGLGPATAVARDQNGQGLRIRF